MAGGELHAFKGLEIDLFKELRETLNLDVFIANLRRTRIAMMNLRQQTCISVVLND
jgi:hypothetical protein